MVDDNTAGHFPTAAGILVGIGLGGFFDGILLHQILQWHHLASSAGYPADNVPTLEFNTLLDGLFHASTYVCVVVALALFWVRRVGRTLRGQPVSSSARR